MRYGIISAHNGVINIVLSYKADIIGHRDIKSTMAYKRYALNKKEIQKLLNKIDQDS